jgi:TfoX/Sxy family transcriptional regulator of competence genes
MGDSELLSRVRAALAPVSNVKEKKMFGSTAFMVRGKLCISARAERIMCRIDPAIHDAALEREGCHTVVMRGRQFRGYVYVAVEAVKTSRALKYWVDLALNYNNTITSTKKRKA